jgi:hypothetical protein
MALPIIEEPLYGQITLETSEWASTFTWVDRTADLVQGINYSQGGRVGLPGSKSVDVGTLNATFKNLATAPLVGDLVRLRRTATSEYAFIGYVQDVSQRVVFDNSVSLNTPVVLTTINCLDWVGYVSQFQAIGVGGYTSGGAIETDSTYQWDARSRALNRIVDSSGSTAMIDIQYNTSTFGMGDTDIVGSLTDHLDLISRSVPTAFWFGTNNLPTNITTGRTNLVRISDAAGTQSSAKTFTDVAGTAGQLHYTEIDFENSSQNVANTIAVNNRVRLDVTDVEITRIGGFNEENYMSVNGSNVVGVVVETTQTQTLGTSITTYGVRRSEFDTNTTLSPAYAFNQIINPSVEYSDDGYTKGSNNQIVRRRQPSQDANPFAAYDGLWAMRARHTTASTAARILFSGGEADGIPVVAATTYYFKGYAARGTVSRTDMRAAFLVRWYDDSETLLSTTTTGRTTLTTANTWYLVSGSAAAPANAVRATIEMEFDRSGGGNITVGDRLWADAWMFSKYTDNYFTGDTPTTSGFVYGWTGGVGASPSFKTVNIIDNVAAAFVNKYATTTMRATRIRWNAQEDLTAVSSLSVGKTLSLVYDGTTTTHRIVGIDGNIDPERYMIDYYLEKV